MIFLVLGIAFGVLGRYAGQRRDPRLVVAFLFAVVVVALMGGFDTMARTLGLILGSMIGTALVEGRERILR